MKTAVILLEGAAGPPHDALVGRTALQAARTPALDGLARTGVSGLLRIQPKRLLQRRSQLAADILWGKVGSEVPACASLSVHCREGDPGESSEFSYALSWATIAGGVISDFPRIRPDQREAFLQVLREGMPRFGFRLSVDKLDQSIWITFDDMPSGPVLPIPEKAIGQRPFIDPGETDGTQRIAAFQRWLHERLDGHPLNRERSDVLESEREVSPEYTAPVNGVWLWEGGSSHEPPRESLPSTTCILTDNAWTDGLGRWAESAVIPINKELTDLSYPSYSWDHAAWLQQMIPHEFLAVFVENAGVFGQYEGPLESVRRLEALDREVFGPVIEALQRVKPCRIWVIAVPAPGPISDHATAWQMPFCCFGEGLSPDEVQQFGEVACLQGRGGRLTEKEILKLINKDR